MDEKEVIRIVTKHLENRPVFPVNNLRVGKLHSVDELHLDGSIKFSKKVHYFNDEGEPYLDNSWVGVEDHPPGYWKDPFGRVHLLGRIKDGLINSAFTQLHPGCWPEKLEHLRTQSSFTLGRIDVWTDGSLVPMPPASNLEIILDGLVFRVKEGK